MTTPTSRTSHNRLVNQLLPVAPTPISFLVSSLQRIGSPTLLISEHANEFDMERVTYLHIKLRSLLTSGETHRSEEIPAKAGENTDEAPWVAG